MTSRIFDPRDPRLVASISTTQDARNAGRRNERTVEDSRDFREIQSIMNNRYGVCG